MAVKKVKKRKRKFGSGGFSGGSSREQSPLRPKNIEKKPPCHDTCPSGNRIREFVRAKPYIEGGYGYLAIADYGDAFMI